jgi:hypothetical protein
MLSSSATDSEVRDFIRLNRNAEVRELLLRRPGKKKWDWIWIGQQIEGFQKAEKKLPNMASNEGILFPKRLSIEQCSSEAAAGFKTGIAQAEKVLDLSGGFGIDTIAFAKQGASVDYVEIDADLCEIMNHNAVILGLDSGVSVHNTKAEEFLNGSKENYDLVFIDPARRDDSGKKVFRFADCSPDVVELKDRIFRITDRILIKAAPMLDIRQGLRELGAVSDVWILSTSRECKELLFLMQRDFSGEPKIHCHELQAENDFSFTIPEEESADVNYSIEGQFFHLPNPAISKAGAFNSLAGQFDLNLVHPNTHIFISDMKLENFPGRSMEIQEMLNYGQKRALTDYGYTIILRNFPHSLNDIRRKYKIREGSDKYLKLHI